MTRPIDRHLDSDELDALVSLRASGVTSSGHLSEQAVEDAQRHVESCQDCHRKVQMHESVQSEISRRVVPDNISLGPGCIRDSEWVKVAAGLLPESDTRELMKHAAQCGHCGPLLKNAAETLSDEVTPSEETLLASLRSARPQWQQDMAATLRGSAGVQQKTLWWRAIFAWPTPAYAFVAIAAVAIVTWIGVRTLRPPSAEQLLAQAYTDRRTLEVRIPGARYAPLRVERSEGGSNLDKPESLLKAEVLIGENLRKNPNDPAWLQARARADLLDGNYESAIKALQRALDVEPDSPALLIDIGSAYFVQAKSIDQLSDYGNAIESLGRALAKNPDDPVALFNRALACEQMFLYTQAVDDWKHYLRVDPAGGWADEARKRLATVQQRLNGHETSMIEPLLSPTELLLKVKASDESTWNRVDSRIEDYLDLATRSWLQIAFSVRTANVDEDKRTSAEHSLQTLATILAVQHGDHWLADFIRSRRSETLNAAIQALREALDANAAGNPSLGQLRSLQAERLFSQAGSQAGVDRAKMEELYSLHRLFHSSECLHLASQIGDSVAEKRYMWIETQLRMEQFSCFDSQAKMDRGERVVGQALNLATDSGYSTLLLRAIGFAAILETDKGDFATAAAWDQSGLFKYWSGAYPPMRAYQFYDDLTDQAQRTERWHMAVSTAREAVRAIAATPNRPGEGMAHLQLAISMRMTGDSDEAAKEYAAAKNIFTSLPSNPGVRGIEADAELQLAEAEAGQGQIDDAEARLSRAKADLPIELDSFGTWLTYYRTQAQIARKRGNAERLQQACTSVVAIGELGLATILTDRDRLTWNRSTSRCYRDLVTAKLRENDPVSALAILEWYRGSAVRVVHPIELSSILVGVKRQAPLPLAADVEQNLRRLNHETVLVYAELGDVVSAWMFDDRGVYWQNLAVNHVDLSRVASEFGAQCADPNSSVSNLQSNGRLLYSWLVAPFEGRMDSTRTLVIEADGSLAAVPFQALVEPDGSYLESHRALVFSPGLDYMLRLREDVPISPGRSGLVVENPAVSLVSRTTFLSDADREATQIAQLLGSPVVLTGKHATAHAIIDHLERAVVFHFAGHAISGPEGVGLEVAPETESIRIASRSLLSPERIAAVHAAKLSLVVLSACSTGRAGEDGLAGAEDIAAAFLRTGVPHVVGSRWNVNSASTADLMVLTYRAILSGESVPRSLRKASLQMSSSPATSHPYYWAAFAVFGSA